ncbi:LysR family transcriptional regulator [Gellertiella hungarica]|uniref:DNA-binding transcriptional LysR family regulator n=1 Tax=Gellertiella hungarica TaxID=1572859 RepID=A0A7W6J6Y2_9HYPH|nr:LysR family transcriptional regulator [Gellertiella hungarica]MBB4065938.1 DNA-binding transcriptional LysR family regulator [Gellertiella hungarica]
MSKPFDWDLLRSFLAVARSGKLTLAARRLKVDHSTLSRRIAALETSLKAKLFDRSLNGYTLTLDGERLLAEAERIEAAVMTIQSEIAEESTAVSGTVRIGSPDGFGTCFLAPRIGALAERHPDLDIELVATPRSFSLSKREADIAIGLSNPGHARLYTLKLTDYELGVYGAAHRVRDWQDVAEAADLQRKPFVSYIDDLIYTPELDYLPLIARALTTRMKSSNLMAQAEAVAAGAGLAVLPCFLAEGDARFTRLLPDKLRLIRTFYMSVHEDTRKLARIKATMDFLVEAIRSAGQRFLPG